MIPLPLIGAGIGALGNIVGGIMQNNAANKAAKANSALVDKWQGNALGYIDQGNEAAGGYLGQVNDLYAPLAQLGTQAGQMYGNALGLNGPEGNAAATAAFQAGPGYQFAMDQGLQALERRGAAQGRLQSGQTGLDTMSFAQGLANQEWGNWLNRLGDPNSMLGQGLAGQAGALNNLANLATGTAQQQVGVTGSALDALMGANNQKAAGGQALGASIGNAIGGLGGFFGGYGGFGAPGTQFNTPNGYVAGGYYPGL